MVKPLGSATYTYIANSPLVDNIVFKQSSTTRMTTRKQYDKLNRLLQISLTTNASTVPGGSCGYLYNNANQRTRVTLVDGSYWIYEYDKLGQVIWGKRYWSDGTPVDDQQCAGELQVYLNHARDMVNRWCRSHFP